MFALQRRDDLDGLGLGLESHDHDSLQPRLGLKLGRVLDVSAQSIVFEHEFDVKKLPVAIFKRLAVVDVERSLGGLCDVESDDQSVGIVRHQSRRSADSLLLRHDGSSSLINGDSIFADGNVDGAGSGDHLSREDVVPDLVGAGEENVGAGHSLFGDGSDEESSSYHVLVVDLEGSFIFREFVPERSHRWSSGLLAFVEESVPEREVAVPPPDGLADSLEFGLAEQPRFATLGVDVSVRPEERLEGRGLVPANKERTVRVVEETSDV